MVRQLLTVSRLDSGVLHPVPEVFAPAGLVRRAWEALGATGVEFSLDDRSGGWLAYADPDQVDQVIWGLLDNAVKYGGGSAITVSVELVRGEGASADRAAGEGLRAAVGALLLRVADAGPGIAEADRAHLFERYARGTAPGTEGTGLGLYCTAPVTPRSDAFGVSPIVFETATPVSHFAVLRVLTGEDDRREPNDVVVAVRTGAASSIPDRHPDRDLVLDVVAKIGWLVAGHAADEARCIGRQGEVSAAPVAVGGRADLALEETLARGAAAGR